MRNFLILFLLLSSVFAFSQQKELNSFVKKLPVPHKAVNDFGRFLTSSERDTLETELKSYLKQTTNAIVVVTLESLTDPKTEKEYTIEEAALAYFNTWGVGDKIKNNGVLLMVSRNPRKVRIQVGTGLGNILTNESCQQIVDNNLVPNFKQGLFFAGIKEAVIAIEQRLDNLALAAQQATAPYLTPTIIQHESVDKPYDNNNPVIGFSIIGGIILVCILYLKYGRPLSSGWYTRDGYIPRDDWNLFGSHSSGGGWSSGGSSGGGSSGGGSYGGGSSSGGGASGGW
ncbi:MAG: TPM domain-containing protein [Niastella sp.]|uniref:TPM domain-containing protein n=1 Tax=Niastella sp. TaxID=1869183 RepID=UPI00389A8D9A